METQQKRKAIVFDKTGSLKSINANRASYDPLMYTIMFLYGQLGWEYNFYKLNLDNEKLCTQKVKF